jgi:hypothetical protein
MTKHSKLTANMYKKPLLLYAGVNLLFFLVSYCGIKGLVLLMNPYVLFVANIAISLYVARSLKTTTLKKVVFVIAASIISSIIGFLLILSTMKLPGSREHNHIMYDICLPAIKKHYELNENDPFPADDGRHDKDGMGKWWYQHSECEKNVLNGKGPVFSEEPTEFEKNVIK